MTFNMRKLDRCKNVAVITQTGDLGSTHAINRKLFCTGKPNHPAGVHKIVGVLLTLSERPLRQVWQFIHKDFRLTRKKKKK